MEGLWDVFSRRGPMKASILDLRYKTRDILAALANGEKVTVTERGKERGVILPSADREHVRVLEDPFFGMKSAPDICVEEIMDNLRGKRHDL